METKPRETKLAAAAAAADEILDAMGDGLLVLDLDGNVTSINKAMSNYLAQWGLDAEKSIGKSVFDLGLIKPEDMEKYAGLFEEVVKKGEAGPFEAIGISGKWVSVTVSSLKDAECRPSVIFAVVRDITELKILQEKEKEMAAEKARAEEAEKFTKELQEKVKELEDFHDLAVGRELKMKKMEEEMEELKKRIEEKEK